MKYSRRGSCECRLPLFLPVPMLARGWNRLVWGFPRRNGSEGWAFLIPLPSDPNPPPGTWNDSDNNGDYCQVPPWNLSSIVRNTSACPLFVVSFGLPPTATSNGRIFVATGGVLRPCGLRSRWWIKSQFVPGRAPSACGQEGSSGGNLPPWKHVAGSAFAFGGRSHLQ